jgi:hypothetical protein
MPTEFALVYNHYYKLSTKKGILSRFICILGDISYDPATLLKKDSLGVLDAGFYTFESTCGLDYRENAI